MIGSHIAAIFPTAERETRAIIAPIETIQLHTDPFQQFFFRGREEIRSNNQPGLFGLGQIAAFGQLVLTASRHNGVGFCP